MAAADCHPKRQAVVDGLCLKCVERRSGRLAAKPGTTLAKQNTELQMMYAATMQVEEYGRLAKAILQQRMPGYAHMHFQAAEIAASKGDSRPAEWALQHVRTGKEGPPVDPPAKVAPDTGVRVYLGIRMGNMPEGLDVGAIEVESKMLPQTSNG